MRIAILAAILAVVLVLPTAVEAQGLPGGGLPYLVLHVVPADADRSDCTPQAFPGSECSDLRQGSGLNLSGDLDTDYDVYLVAIDVRTARGMRRATVGVTYNAASLEISDWWSCGTPTASSTWPAPGSNISTHFDDCRGTAHDGRDPEGDASVVLAVLRVRASAPAPLTLIPVFGQDSPAATVEDCSGTVDVVAKLGWAGFGLGGVDPCSPAVEEGCSIDPNGDQWFCCGSATECLEGAARLSKRACEFHGGAVVIRPCSEGTIPCAVACATPVEGRTWGALKALYR